MAKTKTKRAAKTKSKKKTAKRKAGKKKTARRGKVRGKFKVGDLVVDETVGRSGEVVEVSKTGPNRGKIRVRQDAATDRQRSVLWWDVTPSVKKRKPSMWPTAVTAKSSLSAKSEVDFDDEDAVFREVAEAIGEEDLVDQATIEDVSHQVTTSATVYQISTHGHRREWMIFRDYDDVYEEAKARVKQDLENDPESFGQDLIESHIDMQRLKTYVYDSAMEDSYVDEMRARDFWREFKRAGFDSEEYEVTDEDGDTELPDDVPDEAIEMLKEHYATAQAKDPMGRMRDIYGDEAAKYAIDAAGFDVDAAAEEFVDEGGWESTPQMATYDGNYETTPSGFIVFRTN